MTRPTDSEMLDWLERQADHGDGLRIACPSILCREWRVGVEPPACEHTFGIIDSEMLGAGTNLREAIAAAIAREKATKP